MSACQTTFVRISSRHKSILYITNMITVIANSVLCLLIVPLVFCSAETCGPGSFVNGTKCTKCPPGSYQYQTNADSCIICRPGTYSRGYGAQVANACLMCPGNTISSSGAGSCTPCPPESFAIRNKTKCVSCPPGKELNYHDDCVPCSPKFFRPDRSSQDCQVCPHGYISKPSRTSCKKMAPCPLGYELGFRDCNKCFGGYFRGKGMDWCEKCPAYTYSPPGVAKCLVCPAGQFLKDSRCKNCPSGSKTVGEGGIICRKDNALCPVSYFEKSNRDCHSCYPGYRFDLVNKKCKKCAENEYSPGGVVINCEKCPKGMVGVGVSCFCPAGKRLVNGRCSLCPAGTYRMLSSSFANDECHNCWHPMSETYDVSSANRSICESCPGRTITTDGKKCIVPTAAPCPPGFVRDVNIDYYGTFGPCISEQTGCLPGLVPRIDSEGRLASCRNPDGTRYCPEGTIVSGSRCVSCTPGSYLKKYSSGRIDCIRCPKNAHSPGGLVWKCTTCPNNFRRAKDFISCSCTATNARGHYIDSRGRCSKCPAGTYANNNHEEEIHECKPCPAGTFNAETGQSSCKLCPANSFSNAGATQCRKCPAGTVSYGLGESSCVPVLKGGCVEFTKVLACGSLASRGKCAIQTQKQTCRNGKPSSRVNRETLSRTCAEVRECAILPTERERW